MVRTTLNYLAPMDEKPVYYQYRPPAGTPWRNTRGDRRTLSIHDARELDPEPSLDAHGFVLVPVRTAVRDLYDADAVRRVYYSEVEALVRAHTGA